MKEATIQHKHSKKLCADWKK